MKILTTTLVAIMAVAASAAHARDVNDAEALELQNAGTIQTAQMLQKAALATHPGATITDTELENEYGKYIYQVELRDVKGLDWDLEIDAVTGQVYKNHQDN